MFFIRNTIAFIVAGLTLAGGIPCAQPTAREPQLVDTTGNRPVVRLRIEPDSVMLGDRFRLFVEVEKDLMQGLEFPEFQNNRLADSIEIMHEGPVDTLRREGRRITLGREYELTCFEPGRYNMGRYPVLYLDKNRIDTLWSIDTLKLFVGTFEIDTTTQQIYDIKPPLATPLRFGEISGYLLRILIGLIVLGIIAYILIRRIRNKPLLGGRNPDEPPHVTAIKALEKLHAQKLWQSGKIKPYYSALTDILREYMEQRYGFPAPEYTSSEILERLNQEELPPRTRERIGSLLPLSDLVKFAKYLPGAGQNEEAYQDAFYFVEESKPCEQDEPTGSDTADGKEVDQ